MKIVNKVILFTAFIAIMGFLLVTCSTKEYIIGEKGPGGGIVFYDKGRVSDGWRYLEAAPEDQGNLKWASSGFESTNIPDTETAIGTGKANTAAIIAVDANAPAAKACVDYRGGDKRDWFLPSRGELNEMYKAHSLLGISSELSFWSSSQANDNFAWYQNFYRDSDHGQNGFRKSPYENYVPNVRAVRAF